MRRLEERMARKRLIALGREAERAKRAIDAGYTARRQRDGSGIEG